MKYSYQYGKAGVLHAPDVVAVAGIQSAQYWDSSYASAVLAAPLRMDPSSNRSTSSEDSHSKVNVPRMRPVMESVTADSTDEVNANAIACEQSDYARVRVHALYEMSANGADL